MGSATGGSRGSMDPPRINWGSSNRFGPTTFFKILKFYLKILELIIVLKIAIKLSRSQNIFLNLATIFSYSESIYFVIYTEFLNILTF